MLHKKLCKIPRKCKQQNVKSTRSVNFAKICADFARNAKKIRKKCKSSQKMCKNNKKYVKFPYKSVEIRKMCKISKSVKTKKNIPNMVKNRKKVQKSEV